MKKYTLTVLPDGDTILADAGENLLQALRRAGYHPDAPCGGHGSCGKCKALIREPNGEAREVLACQTSVTSDLYVTLHQVSTHHILASGTGRKVHLSPKPGTPDGHYYQIGFDIGTTTVVGYLIDGANGSQLAVKSVLNPQSQYGADVIGRADYVLHGGGKEMAACIRTALNDLTDALCAEAKVPARHIRELAAVGNACIQHLFLELPVETLVRAPYHPVFYDGYRVRADALGLHAAEDAMLKILPNIGGFVGSDTVACMIATDYDAQSDVSLMIDIGTNGEVVLGNKDERYACSTAAGPALEGAKISCGMRGAAGAIDHVRIEDGALTCSVIGGGLPTGICGSGLIDLIAVLLSEGMIDDSGLLMEKEEMQTPFQLAQADRLFMADTLPAFSLSTGDDTHPPVYLTQRDIREVQLAKSAIASGIACLMAYMHVTTADIRQAWIAGAFGNYMDAGSACAIGLFPPELRDRFQPIGNAAGEGAKIVLLDDEAYQKSNDLAKRTTFVELATCKEFQDLFVDNLSFS